MSTLSREGVQKHCTDFVLSPYFIVNFTLEKAENARLISAKLLCWKASIGLSPKMQDTGGASASDDRFIPALPAGEEHLKSQTVGLMQLNDFRKRRVEALEPNGVQQKSL